MSRRYFPLCSYAYFLLKDFVVHSICPPSVSGTDQFLRKSDLCVCNTEGNTQQPVHLGSDVWGVSHCLQNHNVLTVAMGSSTEPDCDLCLQGGLFFFVSQQALNFWLA